LKKTPSVKSPGQTGRDESKNREGGGSQKIKLEKGEKVNFSDLTSQQSQGGVFGKDEKSPEK